MSLDPDAIVNELRKSMKTNQKMERVTENSDTTASITDPAENSTAPAAATTRLNAGLSQTELRAARAKKFGFGEPKKESAQNPASPGMFNPNNLSTSQADASQSAKENEALDSPKANSTSKGAKTKK